MNSRIGSLIVLIAILFAAPSAFALNFDREIQNQNRTAKILLKSLSNKNTYQRVNLKGTKKPPKSDESFSVALISKKSKR